MIKALIVDDEKICRDLLISLLNRYLPEIVIIGEASCVEDACTVLEKHTPNLLFIDIQMPGRDGFQLLECPQFIQLNPVGVIFTTAYDQYAMKAFRYAAIDYLLKPVNKDELFKAVERFEKMIMNNPEFIKNIDLLKSIQKNRNFERICLSSKNGMIFTHLTDILYLEAQGSYTSVCLLNRKNILVCKPIINFEKLLEENGFLRVHRSYIVNVNHIQEYNSIENILVLTNNVKVEVSYRKKQSLLKVLTNYLQP